MKIFLTGGTGFTGSALALRLAQEGHRVTSLDYQPGIRSDELKQAGVELVEGSITHPELVDRCTQGAERVLHVAAAFRELDVPDSHYKAVNVGGTRNVMASALKHQVPKVVYCSTQGVHGHVASPPGNEDSPIEPEDYYQETKYEGEKVTLDYFRKGLKVTILRPTAIYGPGDPERFFMIYKRANKGFFPMFGSGKTFYHPLYIDNLVYAFLLAMDPDKGNGQAYIIGDEKYLTIRELVEKVGESMGKKVTIRHYPFLPLLVAGHVVEKVCKPFGIAPPLFPRRVDWYRQVRAFSIDKARRDLGYVPKVGLEEGLKKTADWYVEKGYL